MLACQPDNSQSNRRRFSRLHVSGVATLWHGDAYAGAYRIQDVSFGGMLLRGGPAQRLGDTVTLRLHLSQGVGSALQADVVRVHEEGSVSVAVRVKPGGPNTALMERLVEGFLDQASETAGVALVVSPTPNVLHHTQQRLLEIGWKGVGVLDAVDAMQLLVERRGCPSAVLLDLQADPQGAGLLLEYLARNHPSSQRFALGAAHECADAPASYVWDLDGVLPRECSSVALGALLADAPTTGRFELPRRDAASAPH